MAPNSPICLIKNPFDFINRLFIICSVLYNQLVIISTMESQEAPKVVDVENMIPCVREEPTEIKTCGCRGQMPAQTLKALMKK